MDRAPHNMTKILYIIPANLNSKGDLIYSSFIKNEIKSILDFNKGVEVDKFFLFSRLNPISVLKSIALLKKRIKLFRPDIIHSEVGSITSFVSLFAKDNKPMIVTFGGSDLLGLKRDTIYWKLRSFLSSYMSTYSAERSDKVICVSESLKAKLPYKINDKVTVIPRGVDITFFKPLDFEKIRNDLGWKKDEKVILFNYSNASALVKNLPLAKDVIKILNVEFNVKSRLEILENLTKEEVLYRMNASDILLVTSFHEGSPNIVKESMACNLPIVSVNVGDVAERIENCENSRIVSYNANEIASKIKDILKENKRSNGREILIQDGLSNFDTSKKIVNIYNDCLIK